MLRIKKCKFDGCDRNSWKGGFCQIHCEKSGKGLKKGGNIKKYSKKGLERKKLKTENTQKLHSWFLELWDRKPHYCQSCDKWLGNEPKSIFFDHLIEKSGRRDLEFEEDNMYFCCGNCHTLKTNGFPTEKHKKAIEEAKIKFNV